MSTIAQDIYFVVKCLATGAERNFQRPPFPDEARRKLLVFCECAQSLNECAFAENPLGRKGSLHFGKDGSVTNKGDLPPDDEIGAFLHRLRPIYLNNEETNFNCIANIVGRHISDPDVTEAIRYWKQFYEGRDSQKIFTVQIKGKTLNSDEFFNNYVNALEYHRDQERRQYIDQIAESFPLEAQKSIFVLLLGLKLNAITKLGSFILACLHHQKGQPVLLRIPSFGSESNKPVVLPQ